MNAPVSEIFPGTRLLRFVPGYGSLFGKDWSQNHDPTMWNPVITAACETFGLTQTHSTISSDCHWEYVGSYYQFPHNICRSMALLDSRFLPPVRPLNLGAFTVDLSSPTFITQVCTETTRYFSTVEMFFKLFIKMDPQFSIPTHTFEKMYGSATDQDFILNFEQYIATIYGKIDDEAVNVRQNLPVDRRVREFYVQFVAWAITCRIIHIRLKARMLNDKGEVDPLFRNIHSLKYCNFNLYLQLAGRERIWENQRKFPILIPHTEIIERSENALLVSFCLNIVNLIIFRKVYLILVSYDVIYIIEE